MVCEAITTGEQFLAGTLAYIDCQAKTIGSLGFGALAAPGSVPSLALTGLLTLFVAIFGIRLLLGYPTEGRDLVGAILKVAIVLMLATGWPAWRILGYDVVTDGPSRIAQAIGLASQLPGSAGDFSARLQHVDGGILALNAWGSGRLGVAQGDWFQLGFARIVWLAGTLGPLALVRISAGILLAIAPLMAGLLLFGITRAIFEGWLRALAMTFLASIFLALTLGTQTALIEPWLVDVLHRRAGDMQTLEAPAELLVIALSFALLACGAIWLSARIAFHTPSFVSEARHTREGALVPPLSHGASSSNALSQTAPSRAYVIAGSVAETVRREERSAADRRAAPALLTTGQSGRADSGRIGSRTSREALGTSHRRAARRVSGAHARRDSNS